MEKQSTLFLRLLGRISVAVGAISLVVLVIGNFYEWSDPVKFSNAFFTVGAILIVLGLFCVAGGFMQRANFNITYSESAGQANLAERGQRIAVDINQRYGSMIFLLVSGLLLIGIAIAIGNFMIIS
jgi:hypothetical protein